MTIKEFVDGFRYGKENFVDAGILKMSKNNRDEIKRLEMIYRKSIVNKQVKFTKADKEKLEALYRMADFIGR